MFEAANRLEHKELKSFVEQRVRLKPKTIYDILKVLKSDLAFDPTLVKSTLTDDFLDSLNLRGKATTPRWRTGTSVFCKKRWFSSVCG